MQTPYFLRQIKPHSRRLLCKGPFPFESNLPAAAPTLSQNERKLLAVLPENKKTPAELLRFAVRLYFSCGGFVPPPRRGNGLLGQARLFFPMSCFFGLCLTRFAAFKAASQKPADKICFRLMTTGHAKTDAPPVCFGKTHRQTGRSVCTKKDAVCVFYAFALTLCALYTRFASKYKLLQVSLVCSRHFMRSKKSSSLNVACRAG